MIITVALAEIYDPLVSRENRCKRRRARHVAVDEGSNEMRSTVRVQRSDDSRHARRTVLKIPLGKHDATISTVVLVRTSSSQK